MANYLAAGHRLVNLNVEGTSFDNSCLSQLLQSANQLIRLNMARTNITDDGFSQFSEVRAIFWVKMYSIAKTFVFSLS
jgi:hypothetical protein